METKPVIVIACGYTSGIDLPTQLQSVGYDCINIILERLNSLESFAPNNEQYIKNIIVPNENELSDCIQELKQYNIAGVIPGSEAGVILADKISCYFNVPQNIPELSMARRDKFCMIEAIRSHGLQAQKQIKSSSLSQITQWYDLNRFKRIVLKPLMSAVSDNVYYCDSVCDIELAFNTILGDKTVYNELNQEVLAQEYIDGDEYIVNTFSFDGQHKIIDVWVGVNNDPNVVSNDLYADLIPQGSEEHNLLSEYTSKALDALGVQYGPTHCEIRINSLGKPYLIECGARLAGKAYPQAIEAIYGESQFSLLIKMYSGPKEVQKFISKSLSPNCFARYVYFKTDIEGLIINEINMNNFLDIPSLYYIKFFIRKGEKLLKTCKVKKVGRPGFAYLLSNSVEQLEKDYRRLVLVEKQTYEDIINHEKAQLLHSK